VCPSTRTCGVDEDFAALQVDHPGPGERPHRGLGCAVDTKDANTFGSGYRGVQNDRTPVPKKRKRLLNGEKKPHDVDAKRLLKVDLGYFPYDPILTQFTKQAVSFTRMYQQPSHYGNLMLIYVNHERMHGIGE
jgi:hypothetical protein